MRGCLYQSIVKVLPLPQLRVVVPPVAIVDRLITGRWWSEAERETVLDPERPDSVEAVDGDAQTIDDGVGDLLVRRYEIDLPSHEVSPTELLDVFRQDPDVLSPTDYAAFASGPLHRGHQFTISLAGPWNGPVEVAEDEPNRIRLVTLQDHMEAGWIEFSVIDGEPNRFRIESTARAGDRAFWLLHDVLPFARWVQTDMWAHVLESLVERVFDAPPGRVRVMTWRDRGETHTD